MMDTLVAFLKARLVEDEVLAQARPDPTQSLASVASKRALLLLISEANDRLGEDWMRDEFSPPVLKTMARSYTTHPDFRDEWAT